MRKGIRTALKLYSSPTGSVEARNWLVFLSSAHHSGGRTPGAVEFSGDVVQASRTV